MAQIIKHRRGSIGSLKGTTARNAELIVATGSISDLNGPFVFIGSPIAGDEGVAGAFNVVSKIYQGNSAPTLSAGTYGSTLDGTPFYSTVGKSLYALQNSNVGDTKFDLTGNIEGNTISGVTINALTASYVSASANITAINVSASYFTGAFVGDASGLINVPVSGLTGFDPTKIVSGSVSASILTDGRFRVNGDSHIDNNLSISGNTNVTGTIYVGDNTSARIYSSGELWIEDDNTGVVLLSNNGYAQLESTGSYVWVQNGEAYVEGNTFTNIYTISGSVVISSYNGTLELNSDVGENDVNVLNGTNKININGNSNFTGSVNISGNTSVTGALVVSNGSATFDQGLVAQNSNMLLTSGSNLIVQDNGYVQADNFKGNTWNDTVWGICRGVGQNHLGRILMKVRAEIYEMEISRL
jgi:hypothetical protein